MDKVETLMSRLHATRCNAMVHRAGETVPLIINESEVETLVEWWHLMLGRKVPHGELRRNILSGKMVLMGHPLEVIRD